MDVLIPVLLLAAVVAFIVLSPFRSRPQEPAGSDRQSDLEAAKEAKYREIRDAELDFRMGKISEPDWRALDGELRAQAIEILKQLDASN